MSTTARRVLALLPLLLAVPSLAAAQLDSCDAAAVTARVDGTLSSGGSTIAFSYCSAPTAEDAVVGALFVALAPGKSSRLFAGPTATAADTWGLSLGGGSLLFDLPCPGEGAAQDQRCVRVYAVRDGKITERPVQTWTPFELDAARIDGRLADGDEEGARGIAMRMGPPPPSVPNGEDRIYVAFLGNAWLRATTLRKAGDLRSATDLLVAFFALPPILSGAGPDDPSRLTIRPGVGAYAVAGSVALLPTPTLLTRLLDAAEILVEGGERRRASELLEEIVRVAPTQSRGLLLLGDLQWSQRLRRQAEQTYRAFLALASKDGTAVPARVSERLTP